MQLLSTKFHCIVYALLLTGSFCFAHIYQQKPTWHIEGSDRDGFMHDDTYIA